MCNIEIFMKDFYKKYSECKDCFSKRGFKRYYENKDERSNQRKIIYEKKIDKLLQKQNDRFINFLELFRSYIELENR